jgi:hypothetical protein
MAQLSDIDHYRAQLLLDRDGSDLNVAVSRQSRQHEEICRAYVLAKSRAAEANTDLEDYLQAGLVGLRSGNKKATVTDLKAEVKGQEGYVLRARRVREAEREVDEWKAVRESSRQRKDMINLMAQLLINGHLGTLTAETRRQASEKETYADRVAGYRKSKSETKTETVDG